MTCKKIILLAVVFSLGSVGSYAQEQKEFSLSAVVGSRIIDNVGYNELVLQPEFKRGKLGVGLNVLLRWNDKGFRDEDWNEIGNIVNYVQWAEKGDEPLYLRLGKLSNATLGHGFIVDRYSNQGTDTSKGILGSVLDINLGYGGLETLVNDVTDARLYAGRIYFTPLKNSTIPLVNKIILGATYVNDTKSKQGSSDDLKVYGADFGLPIYEDVLTFYADYAKIKDLGEGKAVGLAGKLQLRSIITGACKTEFRDIEDKFIPALFNSLYEVTRLGTSSIQQAKKQKGWYGEGNLDIANFILFSLGYEDLKEEKAPRLYLNLTFEDELFQLLTRQNISLALTYAHERREKGYHLLDFTAPNTTITVRINFDVSKNLSLSYTEQKVYDSQGNKSETSSLSTQVHF